MFGYIKKAINFIYEKLDDLCDKLDFVTPYLNKNFHF